MTAKIAIRRGDVVTVDLSGAIGFEKMNDVSFGTRPCIVVQNDHGNAVSPLAQVVPLTDIRQYKRLPVQVALKASELIMPSSKDSCAECGHVRSIDRVRIKGTRGEVSPEGMQRVDEALRRSLNL